MSGQEVIMGDEVIGTVLSGVISPSLDNTPIGFLGGDRSLEPGTTLVFRQKERAGDFEGRVGEIPFVPLTSRKKMSRFL